jgi:hypothetical protein
LQVNVPGSCCHSFRLPIRQPTFDGFLSEVTERAEAALLQHPVPDAFQVPQVSLGDSARSLMQQVRREVIGDWHGLMIGRGVFGGRNDLAFD